ncbi:MAG: AlpA family transcriptional regulator [Limnohabitans sp.]|nr:MAG: AlpA family transcriptional regulator [Limnohabitans sp.]
MFNSEKIANFQAEKSNLLSRQKVQTKTTLSRSSIYEMIARGEFPKPVKISGRRVAWLESSVDAWIQSRTSTNI